jgi:hypothetical protein
MVRVLPIVALFLAATVGCKKNGSVESAADAQATTTPVDEGFVEISLDPAEEEDLQGSELMVATAKCGDLVALEPAAMMGKLNDGQIRCLDQSLKEAEKQTVKDKLSRVLMADAWAKGDQHRWEGIVRRHLNEIDRSDADLCFKFAKYLSEKGPDYADETMHWAEMALENRTQWTGETHVSRVNSLYKLRAIAAQKKWEDMEAKYAAAPSEALLSEKDLARNQAKTLAREWLEYAKSAGKDMTMPMQLCVSAAGTAEFCAQD